jgi:hypothetical protein
MEVGSIIRMLKSVPPLTPGGSPPPGSPLGDPSIAFLLLQKKKKGGTLLFRMLKHFVGKALVYRLPSIAVSSPLGTLALKQSDRSGNSFPRGTSRAFALGTCALGWTAVQRRHLCRQLCFSCALGWTAVQRRHLCRQLCKHLCKHSADGKRVAMRPPQPTVSLRAHAPCFPLLRRGGYAKEVVPVGAPGNM